MTREVFGFPDRLWQALAERRPPGLPGPERFRSPLRGPWLTSVFGLVLLLSLPLVFLTGLLDWIAYSPALHQSIPSHVGLLRFPYFTWPTRPVWLFRLTEGLHVGLGLVLVPVVLAKLWSVMPKLFAWRAARSAADLLERLSIICIVGGIVFEMVTRISTSSTTTCSASTSTRPTISGHGCSSPASPSTSRSNCPPWCGASARARSARCCARPGPTPVRSLRIPTVSSLPTRHRRR